MKSKEKHYDIENYNYELTEQTVKLIDENKRYDIVIYIHEHNEDVLKDYKKLKNLKKKYKKIKFKIIYSEEYIKKNKKKQIILNIIKILLILIILGTIIYFSMFFIDQNKSQNLSKDIKKYKPEITIQEETQEDNNEQTKTPKIITAYNKEYSKMFSELKKINQETVGWLTVKGTNIDYPVVKHSDNDYYLNKDFENNNNRYGWLFMDYRNTTPTLGQNTIIYGHDSGGVMFGNLYKVLYRKWYTNKNNQKITFNTETESSTWQIFSIYKIDTTSDYLKTNFTGNEFSDFINMITKRSIYNFNVQVSNTDKILTLSTCHGDKQRLVVHAKKLS